MGKGCRDLFGISARELTFAKLRNMVLEANVSEPETVSDYHVYNRLFKQGKINRYRAELKIKTPDGKIKWISDRSLPLRDPKTKKVIGAMGVLQDITENKRLMIEKEKTYRKYRSLIYAFGEVTYEHIVPENTIIWSGNVMQTFGYTRSKLGNDERSWKKRIHPEDLPKVEAEFERAYKENQIFDLEYRVKHKSGHYLWVNDRGIMHLGKTGELESVVGVMKDIDQRKQAEEKFRIIFEFAPDAYYLSDLNGKLVNVNKAAEQVTGYRRKELIGQSFLDLALLTESQIPKAKENLAQSSRGESTGPDEFTLIRKNGSKIPVEISTHPVDIGGQTLVLGIARDITQRKQAEKALRESENRYRTILENSGAATIIVENDFTISFVNRQFEKLSGYSKEEIENRKLWTDFVVKDDLVKTKEYHISRRKKTGVAPHQYEFHFKDRNGIIKNILLTVAMIPGTKKSVASLVDITKQRQLEKEFRQVQRMEAIGQLTGGVAHDFNNLLTIIQGNAQMLELKIDKEQPLMPYIKKIMTVSNRAAKLIKQLLLFSRRKAMEFEPTDLNKTIEELLKMLQRIIGEDINVKTELAGGLWIIKGDEANLEQVIMNIAINARDAMPDGGTLFLKTENIKMSAVDVRQIPYMDPGKYVRLIIEDTGIGMDQETQEKIFDPFFTTKQEEEGTGLGLSVAYGIIKKHHGCINVYSEKGQGSTFKIYLPAQLMSLNEQEQDEIDWENLKGKGERILLVEDDPKLREFGEDVLIDNDYQCDTAGNATQALRRFKKNSAKYDLIISDVVLPDINGVDLVEKLHKIRKSLPVIMISGYSEKKSKRELIKEKNYPFIQKPFDMEKILKMIKQILKKEQ